MHGLFLITSREFLNFRIKRSKSCQILFITNIVVFWIKRNLHIIIYWNNNGLVFWHFKWTYINWLFMRRLKLRQAYGMIPIGLAKERRLISTFSTEFSRSKRLGYFILDSSWTLIVKVTPRFSHKSTYPALI